MELIFIGTSSGKTETERNHSSILLRNSSKAVLIDCGDGISRALLQNKIPFNSIHSIIITHLHADHFTGLAGLITQMKMYDRKEQLNIYIHTNLVTPLRNFIHTCYLFEEALGFSLNLTAISEEQPFEPAEGIKVSAAKNSHIKNKYNVTYYPQELFISLSLLIEHGNGKIFYTSDIGSKDDLYLFNNVKINTLITEAAHVDFREIYAVCIKRKPDSVYLTHYDEETKNILRHEIDKPDGKISDIFKIAFDSLLLKL